MPKKSVVATAMTVLIQMTFQLVLLFALEPASAAERTDSNAAHESDTLPSPKLTTPTAALEPAPDVFSAFYGAIKSPGTWVPLVAAIPFLFDDADRRFSNRMRERENLYGGRAREKSDDMRTTLKYSVWLTVFLPNDCVGALFCQKRWERLGFTAASMITHSQVLGGLKNNIARDRPYASSLAANDTGSHNDSMPSAHTAESSYGASLSSLNISDTNWNSTAKIATQTVLWSTAAAVALARIEGGMHYPTDVLAGAALGNFMATLFHGFYTNRNPAQAKNLQVGFVGPNFSLSYHF